MLTLITGVPGTGKTLNVIKMVSEEPIFKDRPVFYNDHVKELTLPWKQITDEEIKNWKELPKNSVLIIDEADQLLPQRTRGDAPEWIQELARHRHYGLDFLIITQRPKMVDVHVRGLVGRHLHFSRQFGMASVTRFEFERCEDNPTDLYKAAAHTTSRIKLDSKYFGIYKSAEVHTHKRRLPKRVYAVFGCLLLAMSIGAYAFNNIAERQNEELYQIEQPSDPVSLDEFQDFDPRLSRELDYIEQYTPRIAHLPHTAPAYDELMKPVVAPLPNCIMNMETNDCRCYTQQATIMPMPHLQCMRFIAEGFFNPARQESVSAEGPSMAPAPSSPTSIEYEHQRVVILPYTNESQRQTRF